MEDGNPNWWSMQHTNTNPLHNSSTSQPSSLLSLLHHHHHLNFHGGSSPSSSSSSSSSASSSSSTSSLPFSPLVDGNDHSAPKDFPQSWSQLLLGGLASSGEEDLPQARKVESWEGSHVIDPSPSSPPYMDHSKVYNHHHHNPYLMTKQEGYNHDNDNNSSKNNDSLLNFSPNNCKERGRGKPPLEHSFECNNVTTTRGLSKKPRVQSTSIPPLKVRKEKLGDRITALHQIVSPFGKTDTASVLLEAIGYIRFLQSQIEALSSPYLSNGTTKTQHSSNYVIKKGGQKDLRSRGLCLVPTSCTHLLRNDTSTPAADYWAPSVGGGF